jgi:DNA-binding CsgD family transcriptional regulator
MRPGAAPGGGDGSIHAMSLAEIRQIAIRLLEILDELEGSEQLRIAPPTQAGPPRLTSRQVEILSLLEDGHTTDDIAQRLWLSRATVRNHVARTLRALGAHSRIQAVAVARRLGELPPARNTSGPAPRRAGLPHETGTPHAAMPRSASPASPPGAGGGSTGSASPPGFAAQASV